MEKSRELIVIVDDDITNLTIARKNLAETYAVFTAPSGKKLFSLLEKVEPDLILLDVNMPEMNGYEVIRQLKNNEETKQIPIIFLTAKGGGESELEGLSLGAVDYIVKPFSPPLLRKRIELHLLVAAQKRELVILNNHLQELVDAKTQSVLELQNTLLHAMAELVEYRDDITGGHVDRMHNYLGVLLRALEQKGSYRDEVKSWDMELVLQSAKLHDVGKIAIPDEILLKPGKLTAEEFEKIKEHTTFGEKIISKVKDNTTDQAFLDYARTFVSSHHEKWDGQGYPRGLKGEDIPLLGRIMAIVDVYDALVSVRPYKSAFSHKEAIEIIKQSSGTHFDPELVEIFLSCEKDFERTGVT
ncbi:MAG: response regulator [Oscillospiraceae bacterium]|nr:response regulator [Oscillospiraceae bacterium]